MHKKEKNICKDIIQPQIWYVHISYFRNRIVATAAMCFQLALDIAVWILDGMSRQACLFICPLDRTLTRAMSHLNVYIRPWGRWRWRNNNRGKLWSLGYCCLDCTRDVQQPEQIWGCSVLWKAGCTHDASHLHVLRPKDAARVLIICMLSAGTAGINGLVGLSPPYLLQ